MINYFQTTLIKSLNIFTLFSGFWAEFLKIGVEQLKQRAGKLSQLTIHQGRMDCEVFPMINPLERARKLDFPDVCCIRRMMLFIDFIFFFGTRTSTTRYSL